MSDRSASLSLSPGERVWLIPNLRSTILQHIPTRDLVTLLAVSKAHFEGAVAILYETLAFERYQAYIQDCPDKERKQVYQNAVRTIKISWRDDNPPLIDLVSCFAPFPKAIRVECSVGPNDYGYYTEQESILRDWNKQERKEQSSTAYTYTLRRTMVSYGPDEQQETSVEPPQDMSRLPQGWKYQYAVQAAISDPTDDNDNGDDFDDDGVRPPAKWQSMEDVLTRFRLPHYTCDALIIGINGSQDKRCLRSILSTMGAGYPLPRQLFLLSCGPGDLALWNPVTPSLTDLTLYDGPTVTNPQVSTAMTLCEFMDEFQPAQYSSLQELHVNLREDINDEPSSASCPETSRDVQDIVKTALPRQGVKDIRITMTYSLSSLSQMELLLQQTPLIRRLVRHLMPLVDPHRPPTRNFFPGMSIANSGTLEEFQEAIERARFSLEGAFESEFVTLIAKAIEQGQWDIEDSADSPVLLM